MNYFKKQPYPAVLAPYGANTATSDDLAILPGYARQWLTRLLGITIAEDFQVLSSVAMINQNNELAANSDSFSQDWLVFAYSGQGDFWLLHKQLNEIGFYDHNVESYALNNVDKLGIKVEDWLVVGDLFQQFDLLDETNPTAFNLDYTLKLAYKKNFVSQIDSISSGLFERLPFTGF